MDEVFRTKEKRAKCSNDKCIIKQGQLTKGHLFVAANLILASSFIICKLLILNKLEINSPEHLSYYISDIIIAIFLGLLIFVSYTLYWAIASLSLVLYFISGHLIIATGCFLDISDLFLLPDLYSMRDSFYEVVYYDLLLVPPALILLNMIFTKKLSRVITHLMPKKVLGISLFLQIALLIGIGGFYSNNNHLTKNPVSFVAKSALGHAMTLVGSSTDIGLTEFDYTSKFSRTNSDSPDLGTVPNGQDFNLVILLLESTGTKTIGERQREAMPNFYKLCERGVYFSNFYSPYPASIKTIFSLHTGQYSAADGYFVTHKRPSIPLPSLAEPFKQKGYRTALLHAGYFSYTQKLRFLANRGYDVLYDGKTIPGNDAYQHTSWGVDDRVMYEYAKEWIGQNDKPFLLTMIPILPHHPYNLPDNVKYQFEGLGWEERYLSCIYYQDQLLGELVGYLKENGRFDKTIFVVAGDHGEAFAQHKQNLFHAANIYEENIKVPLVISNPVIFDKPQLSMIGGTIPDIYPTILDMFRMDKSFCKGDGMSFYDSVENRMLFYCCTGGGEKLGLRDGDFKYIYFAREDRAELYNLESDPDEMVNICKDFPHRAEYYKDKTLEWKEYTIAFINNYYNSENTNSLSSSLKGMIAGVE